MNTSKTQNVKSKTSTAVKRLHFDDINLGEPCNNNATVSTPMVKRSKKAKVKSPKVAKSNPDVVNVQCNDKFKDGSVEEDNNTHFDGVYVDVDAPPDSEFGSESDYEMEPDHDDRNGRTNDGDAGVSEFQHGTPRNESDVTSLRNDQSLCRYFHEMFDEKMADTRKELESVKRQLAEEKLKNANLTGKSMTQNVVPGNVMNQSVNKVKSPSDTTLYAPAL